jgi:hypothetical protein
MELISLIDHAEAEGEWWGLIIVGVRDRGGRED